MDLIGYRRELEKLITLDKMANSELQEPALSSRIYELYEAFEAMGIRDNRSILLRIDYDLLVNDLILGKLENAYAIVRILHRHGYTNTQMDYLPGTVHIQVRDNVTSYDTTGFGYLSGYQWQIENYTSSICLHPYNDRELPGLSTRAALAKAAIEIIDYALRNRIPLCFPHVNPPVVYEPNP